MYTVPNIYVKFKFFHYQRKLLSTKSGLGIPNLVTSLLDYVNGTGTREWNGLNRLKLKKLSDISPNMFDRVPLIPVPISFHFQMRKPGTRNPFSFQYEFSKPAIRLLPT